MSWRQEAAERAGAIRALAAVRSLIDKEPNNLYLFERLSTWLDEAMRAEMESLRAPSSGPETSAKAAANMATKKGSLRHKALLAYAYNGALTDEEVGDAIGHPRIWPRCSELRAFGLVEPTGETRLVERTQQEADICALTDAGRAVLASIEQNDNDKETDR